MAKPGAKKKPIDIAELERLAGLGLTQAEMCASIGISVSTLENRISETGGYESSEICEAIKRGKAEAAKIVSNKLFELCKRGNLGAIIWYEKTRRGLTDRIAIRIEDEWRRALREHGITPEQVASDPFLSVIQSKIRASAFFGAEAVLLGDDSNTNSHP